MKLSDIMSSMQLSSYAEVALLLFFGAFVAIATSVLSNRRRDEWDHASRLPLSGEEPSPRGAGPYTSALRDSNVENIRP